MKKTEQSIQELRYCINGLTIDKDVIEISEEERWNRRNNLRNAC